MTANAAWWSVDFDEYLRFEREAAEKHELIHGEIVAMAGATRRHNLICGRLHDALRPSVGDGPCILERSDQRLGVRAAGKGWVAYYADLAVYCSDDVHPDDGDTRVDATLIVEVTSKSTEKKDRGVKLEDYLQIPELKEYLIVSHARRELELWTRGEAGDWTRRLVTEGALRLAGGAVIDVARLYENLPD